jgi:hypothetical protein
MFRLAHIRPSSGLANKNTEGNFTFMWPYIVTNYFVIKQTRYTTFTYFFIMKLHVSDSWSAHHQEFIHCTLSNCISRSCSKAVYKPVWHIPLLSVQWINSLWWADELSETCRVSCQNKFVKLVHLVGFIVKKHIWDFLRILNMRVYKTGVSTFYTIFPNTDVEYLVIGIYVVFVVLVVYFLEVLYKCAIFRQS